MNEMHKTVTLRLKDDVYKIFSQMAKSENRSLSNLIETAALKNIRERQFVDDVELAEILSNEDLLERLKEGSIEAKQSKGRFVE
ncbi:hypothetical protein DSCA_11750 [Desulfosarcina alkanivorans]|uniref:Uncharacterized protein n=2 Tax=Desulfosarcina alkanivorans TaxID=571177 RepID=A0A5K7YFJ6_9BACT|nr:hypothetical protein DSCA_11750 [Desulfosarcina alkanivorans]